MDPELRLAVLDVKARAAELREKMAREVEARRNEAAAERWVSGDTEGLLSALPLAARDSGLRRVGRWIDEPADLRRSFAGRVHVDLEGRPLLHERVDDGYVLGLWRYDDDRTEEVRYWGGEPHVTWVLHRGGSQAIGAVGGDLHGYWAERWTWEREQVVRVDRGSAAPGGWAFASAKEAELDPARDVAVLRTGGDSPVATEENRLGDDVWLAALGDALNRAGEFVCDHVVWIAARDAPAELRADVAGLAEGLADALAEAIIAAAGVAGVVAPFCVCVTAGGGDGDRRTLPPSAQLADEAWRRGMVAHSPDDGDAISSLRLGNESGLVVELDVASRLDHDALRGCAELEGALGVYADPAEQARAEPVVAELCDRLTVRLGERHRFAGATPDFLPLVLFGDRYSSDPVGVALERATRTLGRERVEAFVAAMRSQAPARRGADLDLATRALTDRDALEELITTLGLGAHAVRLAHEVAEVGFLLRASGSGTGGSRLGGPALLPPGVGWPTGPGDRPLSFLAAIDLKELPAREAWPTDGWWLFFAELGEDEDGWGFFEPERNVDGARARLLHVPAADEPVEAEPPSSLLENGLLLRHRSVTFEPVLTLPDGYDAAQSLGLDPFEVRAYDSLQAALSSALGEPSWSGGRHWVGGQVTGAQGEPPEEGTELLLHLANDHSLDFSFLDGGTIQFRIAADALARSDYGAVEADPSSC
ncbi:MAG TPA: DUF1963 domain-containing protein [Thermoleophilaceae bacterium]|nr:DUF1963 domain-containing protein [Thermoleophilaceae bacterium]